MKELLKSLVESWRLAALIALVGIVAAAVLVVIRAEPPAVQPLPLQEVWKDNPAMYAPTTQEAQTASDSF